MAVIVGTEGSDFRIGTDEADTMSGLGGNDQLEGRGGNDTIDGGSGNDILLGGSGIDALTGGSGADAFRGTRAELNGDHITDLSIGDRIQVTDLASANFALIGNSITYGSGKSITVDGLGFGRFIVRSFASGFELRLQSNADNDFNGDGRSDILWRDQNGQLTNWLSTPSGAFTANGANAYANVSTDWDVAGTGDFNADGHEDILWRNDNGLLTNWLANGTGGYNTNTAATVSVSPDWNVIGIADFNGDGNSDILWRQNTGQLTDWLGTDNGGFTPNSGNYTEHVATNWSVIATGDFNGDGMGDLLWRETGGHMTNWLGEPDGGFAQNSPNFSEFVVNNWNVIATGDFNGDGIDDLLWREDGGHMTNWLGSSSGDFVQNSAQFSEFVMPNWQVVSTGDFNGDGIDDLLWREDGGHMTNWLGTVSGDFVHNSGNFSQFVSTDWHVQDADLVQI